jgi:beta-glucosidase
VTPDPDLSPLPDDFLWGVATSAYQIEGAATEAGRAPSIWDTFSHGQGTIADGSSGDLAVDHYHRFADDVALMRALGVSAYRFSLSWPRILPRGVGEPNPDGIAFYRRLAEALLDAGITPLVTLYHWDLPQALEDRGGWRIHDSVDWFAGYASVAKQALGELVTDWTTINEPYCAAFLGHGSGIHAPGVSDPAAAHLAAHHLVLAHHAAVAALRATLPRPEDRIGAVLNVIPAEPATDADADRRAAELVDAVHNGLFLAGTLEGRYPDDIIAMQEGFGVLDRIDHGELAEIRSEIDFLGVNYYNVNRVRHVRGAGAPADFPGADGARIVPPAGVVTEMGWGVEPAGLERVLRRVSSEAPGLPIMITENGAALPDDRVVDGVIDDSDRIEYLRGHIAAMVDAVASGIDVRGYFVWSLLDNFEWAHGYRKRFGIVHVDPGTLDRTPKRSALWYRGLIEGR